MIVFPNTKINIGLFVLEKRSDGFHNIESIFYPVMNLFDVLEIVKSENIEFSSTGIAVPGDVDSNLCLRAFHLLQQDFSISNVKIHLHKNIPVGAGLGGGSSNAAFMLKALNELFEIHISPKQLVAYARKLGSDCAFFIENKPVFAFNKGDEYENVAVDLFPYDIKIEYPKIHISTAEAYGGVKPTTNRIDLKKLVNEPILNWKAAIKNDFEESIFPKHPEIEKLKEKMYSNGAIFASMTGSGSAVFGIFNKTL